MSLLHLLFPPGLGLTKLSETATTITLGWRSEPGIGYRFSKDGEIVSHTWDASRSQVRFSKGQSYGVQAILPGESDVFP